MRTKRAIEYYENRTNKSYMMFLNLLISIFNSFISIAPIFTARPVKTKSPVGGTTSSESIGDEMIPESPKITGAETTTVATIRFALRSFMGLNPNRQATQICRNSMDP